MCSDLNLSPRLLQRRSGVTPVPLTAAVRAQAAAIRQAEALQGKTVDVARSHIHVAKRLHQTVALEFGVLQVRSEVILAEGYQAGQTGFDGLARLVHTRITGDVGLLLAVTAACRHFCCLSSESTFSSFFF